MYFILCYLLTILQFWILHWVCHSFWIIFVSTFFQIDFFAHKCSVFYSKVYLHCFSFASILNITLVYLYWSTSWIFIHFHWYFWLFFTTTILLWLWWLCSKFWNSVSALFWTFSLFMSTLETTSIFFFNYNFGSSDTRCMYIHLLYTYFIYMLDPLIKSLLQRFLKNCIE